MTEYRVINPATGEEGTIHPTVTDSDVQDVLARSERGYQSWRTTRIDDRAATLTRVAELYTERAGDLATLITTEMGKTTKEALGEVKLVAAIFRYYADQGPGFLADAPLDPQGGGTGFVRKAPIGSLLGVMPWNFPYYQVARFAAPNLMLGNTIILKHASQCPESALAIQQIFIDAGLPEDAYINIFASTDQIADMVADARIAGVSVTGSEGAGSAVAEVAGKNLKKVVLELGGSDAFVVLDAADLTPVVKAAVAGRVGNAGQACNGTKRIIVVDALYDDFVEQFTEAMAALTTGDPTDDATDFGPMSSQGAVDSIAEQVQDAIDQGATVRTGGARLEGKGAYFPATVLTDVTPDMRAYSEELFGPVAVVHRATDVEHAIKLANDSDFGLGGTVFSDDLATAQAAADQIDTGMVWINSAQGSAPDLPFGGTKRSGVGRELAADGMEEFVNRKLIYAPRAN
jgi:succinate-semialdehyde dehydrogenase/glutarate-semialdehyde dehydrogenase